MTHRRVNNDDIPDGAATVSRRVHLVVYRHFMQDVWLLHCRYICSDQRSVDEVIVNAECGQRYVYKSRRVIQDCPLELHIGMSELGKVGKVPCQVTSTQQHGLTRQEVPISSNG
jgi:hypothetical protein